MLKDVFTSQKRIQFILTLFFSSISILSFGQNSTVELIPSCIEYIGDGSGRYSVSMGYENTGSETVVVEESSSVITYNHGQSKKYAISTFLPGKHEKVFTQEIAADDRVVWEVVMPNGKVKIVSADINSNHCRGLEFITPYYTPPPGGKLKGSLIGTELNALYEESVFKGDDFNPSSNDIYQIDELFNVYIEVVPRNGQTSDLVGELNNLVPTLSASTDDFLHNRASYWFPIDLLIRLNDFLFLNYARPVFTEIPNTMWNQGDAAMRSEYTRMGFYEMGNDPDKPFNLDGSGVRVGVISNSYNTKDQADEDVDNEHLPPGVGILKDIITTPGFTLSDEGRAMLQIVHDVAPGAELVFRTGYLGELDMANGIMGLADPSDEETGNCDIIVDDITYITEPFFRDGIISQTIDEVVTRQENKVTYFSSAGNFASSSCEGVFQAGSPLTGVKGKPHNFSTANNQDIFQLINLKAGTYTLVLQWDDGTDPDLQAVTGTDMDIFLSDNKGNSLLGYNRVNTGGAPVEVLPFTVSEENVAANILIVKASGPDVPVAFKYVVFRGGLGFEIQQYGQGSSTIVGHANALGTLAVGAVGYYKDPAGESSVQEYSSTGGSPIIVNGQNTFREKPDFTAPDGVNTSVNLSSGDIYDPDNDGLPNFFGTSAAAPHAAGVAALIIQARNKFDNGESVAPADIRALMRSSAIGNEVGIDGPMYNKVSGYGFIQPYAAIKTFANPKPEILDLEVIPDEITGVKASPGATLAPIKFRIKGNFFVDNDLPERKTKVLFRGVELKNKVIDNPDGTQSITAVSIDDDQTITITHPGFLGNPEIKVENPSISNGPVLDGGISNTFKFSDEAKQDITISAQSFSRKYGQTLPNFETIILEGDGSSDYNASMLFDGVFAAGEKERILERLSFDVKATAASDAYPGYKVRLVFEEPDPNEELDHAISEKYNIIITDGNLSIEKLNLKITPENMTLGYGQVLNQDAITFKYEAGDLTQDELLSIRETLDFQYTNPLPIGVPLVNGITLVRGTALVNNPDDDIIRVVVDDESSEISLYVKIKGSTEFIECNATDPRPRGIAIVNDLPFVQIEEIQEGVGLFNGDEITIERVDGVSYITALGDELLSEHLAVKNGIALVRGTALVNGIQVEYLEDGSVIVNGVRVTGTALVNGVPVVRGTALVNSEHIVRGTALVNQLARGTAVVNEIEIPVFDGIPDVNGHIEYDVDGNIEYELEAISMVNGIPVRGTALVNGVELEVTDAGDIIIEGSGEDAFVNGIAIVRGTALVNGVSRLIGTAIVNGEKLVRGVALVNGLAPDFDLANLNFLASTNTIGTLDFVNGTALVNGLPGVDAVQVVNAANPLTNSFTSNVRGIALVNGQSLVRGTALVNGAPVRGTALVNDAIITKEGEESNIGAIMINHEAEESSSYIPVTFITGTDAGTHKIVPGTFLSNNFNISYGLGTLTINKAMLELTADDQTKTYGQDDPGFTLERYALDGNEVIADTDPEFDGTLPEVALYGSDALSEPVLTREGAGDPSVENVGSYLIKLGTLDAWSNYEFELVDNAAKLEITPASLKIMAEVNGKDYGENDPTTLTLKSYELDGKLVEAVSDPEEEEFDGTLADVDLYFGDQLSGFLSREEGEDVGSYIINGDNLEIDYASGVPGENYLFEFTGSSFCINPFGPGTRAIKPELNCVLEIGENSNHFIASFSYKNDNDYQVYVPIGPDNHLEGDIISITDMNTGAKMNHQPTLFEPGGGEFKVEFYGDELRWIVNSLDQDHKASNSASANSSSTKCNPNTKSARVSASVEEEELPEIEYLRAYPNPVTHRVNLVMKDIQDYKMIILLDVTGRACQISNIKTRSDRMEIDMTSLPSGPYFIRVVMEDKTNVIRVIKQ